MIEFILHAIIAILFIAAAFCVVILVILLWPFIKDLWNNDRY